MRTATWNVSSLVSRSGEIVDDLHRRKVHFCCKLERRGGRVKVRGCLVLMVEDTSSFGKAVIRELLVVGVCIAERWIDSAVNVVRVNEWIMYVKPGDWKADWK